MYNNKKHMLENLGIRALISIIFVPEYDFFKIITPQIDFQSFYGIARMEKKTATIQIMYILFLYYYLVVVRLRLSAIIRAIRAIMMAVPERNSDRNVSESDSLSVGSDSFGSIIFDKRMDPRICFSPAYNVSIASGSKISCTFISCRGISGSTRSYESAENERVLIGWRNSLGSAGRI